MNTKFFKRSVFCLMAALFVYSCAKVTVRTERVEGKPAWFNIPERFISKDRKGEVPIHSFFDLVPFTKMEDREVNFVPTTEQGSLYKYDIDLSSGAFYLKGTNCAQKDIWENYRGELKLPNFTEGFIPRLIDQRGLPQKIVVFGNRRYFHQFDYEGKFSERVRVVGGVVEQYCEVYPCRTNSEWKSRLVLVAVNPSDPKMANVQNLSELKEVEDWGYAKSFLENSEGRNISGPTPTPAYRLVGEVPSYEALKFAVTKGYLFEYKESMNMRNSCLVLYDYIWNSVEKIKENESKTKKDLKPKRVTTIVKESKDIFSGNVISSEKVSEEKVVEESKNLNSFPKFFNTFRKKYGQRFKTCINYVRPSDIVGSIDRHWFMQYLIAYTRLEDLGYVYRCNRRGWVENPFISEGKREVDPLKEGIRCSTEELDEAFESAITVLTGLSRSNKHTYRYIEYDSGIGGSRQRLYSWIYDNGKKTACQAKQTESPIFPLDVTWTKFSDLNELSKKGFIR